MAMMLMEVLSRSAGEAGPGDDLGGELLCRVCGCEIVDEGSEGEKVDAQTMIRRRWWMVVGVVKDE